MTDITMCTGGDCLVKCYCTRYITKPEERQYYFTEPPFTMKDGKVKCDMYWGELQSSIMNQAKEVCNGKV